MSTSSKKGCIIVTGASRGIGAAIALGLAQAGYAVGCLSRSGETPQITGATPELAKHWFSAKCDVSRPEQLSAAFADIAQRSGQPLVGLVNNAGIHSQDRVQDIAEQEFKNVMDVNASFYDKLGVKQHLTYCATKAAVGAMTRCMAVEWAPKGIRVLNVAPGYVMTDFNREMIQKGPLAEYLAKRIPSGVAGEAQDIGNLVTSLFVLNSPYMTGETIYIDGAHGMLQ
jgi:NAD(P)-dependent dehydrogenase (short-subunit alcohol dehydrogenase family)